MCVKCAGSAIEVSVTTQHSWQCDQAHLKKISKLYVFGWQTAIFHANKKR